MLKKDEALKSLECNICNCTYKEGLNDKNPICPKCKSTPETRLYWYYINKYTNFLKKDDIQILHISPEESVYQILKTKYSDNYTTIDIKSDSNLSYNNDIFDLIIVPYILEYLPDDKQLLKELYRTLKPKGELIIMASSDNLLKKTFEYNQISNDVLRKRYYKEETRFRYYGSDLFERIESVGFKTKREKKYEVLYNESDVTRFGLSLEPLFIATKEE